MEAAAGSPLPEAAGRGVALPYPRGRGVALPYLGLEAAVEAAAESRAAALGPPVRCATSAARLAGSRRRPESVPLTRLENSLPDTWDGWSRPHGYENRYRVVRGHVVVFNFFGSNNMLHFQRIV